MRKQSAELATGPSKETEKLAGRRVEFLLKRSKEVERKRLRRVREVCVLSFDFLEMRLSSAWFLTDGKGPGLGERSMPERERITTSPDVSGEDCASGITAKMKQVLTAPG